MAKKRNILDKTIAFVDKKKTKAETLPIEEVNNEVVEEVIEDKKTVNGVVANCQRLNVRKQPSLKAKVKIVVPAGTKVTIIEEDETKEWYKVSTENGSMGFCMAKYITINK